MELSINNSVRLNEYKNKKNNLQNNPNFKGLAAGGLGMLSFLNNSPAIGACAVDLGSMVIPRTVVDTKNRGIDAGTETAVREASSTVNHAIVGVVGATAATVLSGAFNNSFNVKANKIFVNSDAIDVFSSIWKESSSKEDFYRRSLEKSLGLNGSIWKNIALVDEETIEAYGFTGNKSLAQAIAEKLAPITEETAKKVKAPILKKAEDIIKANTGAALHKIEIPKVVIDAAGNSKNDKQVVENTVDVILDNMVALGNAFEKQVKNGRLIDDFVDKIKPLKRNTALLGLGVSTLIGISIQPINKYLTKKRTGNDGFVGVKGRKADKSFGFKLEKAAAAGLMGLFAITRIAKNPKDIINKIQFSSMVPNLNQFKLLYGMTIVSRLLSARDKNELRESSIKDFLGFTNWLILGGIVSKGVARALPGGKDLINYAGDASKKGIKHTFDWIAHSSVKSYNEVLLKDASKTLIKSAENIKFSTLMKNASKGARGNVAKLALAQVAGYLYSGVVLGVLVPKLNIFITNKFEKNKKNPNQEVAFSGTDKTSSLYFAQAHNKPPKKVFEGIFKKM